MSDEREARWRVWRDEPDGEDDAREYPMRPQWSLATLYDAKDAAEYWADCWDMNSAEYSIVGQREEPIVIVEDIRDGERSRFQVSGEAVPSYTARPLAEGEAA